MILYREIVENAAVIYDDGFYAHLKADDIEAFLKIKQPEELSGETIEMTFMVPIESINIDAKVISDKSDDPTYDVTTNEITVDFCEFELKEYDDSETDKLAIQRWLAS